MPCILPENIKDLRRAITENGGFAGLRAKTAAERVNLFKQYVDNPGESATAEWLNREIERRILVPGQIQATKDWIRRLEKKKIKISNKEALIDRILKKKDAFNPKSFYAEGLVKQALGFETGREDAKSLFDKAKTVDQYKRKLLSVVPDYLNKTAAELKDLTPEAQEIRAELGRHLVEFQHLYEAISLKAQLINYANKSSLGKIGEKILKIAGNIKSMKASFDLSFLRQLQNTAYVNINSFKDAMAAGYKTWFGNKEMADTLLAEILTRPNALSGRYNQFGVEVGIKEEAFPESWISKAIDKIGLERLNAFRRSETAFNTAIQTARADLFDWMWERSGGDIKLLKSQNIGAAINTVTGRGQFPFLTPRDPQTSRIMNNLLFAPKWLASRIQTLTDLRYAAHIGEMTPQGIRARAAIGNAIITATMAALGRIIWGLTDEDDELGGTFDPRSTDFGKVIIGRTRFDLTGGTAALIVLVTRLGTGETRKLTGQVAPVKPQNVVWNFLKGKGSPALHLGAKIKSLITTGEWPDYWGKPVKLETPAEIGTELAEIFAPITLVTAGQAAADIAEGQTTPENWGEIMGVLADIIGVGASTYDKK